MAIDIDALCAELDEQLAAVEPEFVPIVLANKQAGIRFIPLSGPEWRDLALKHPPRTDVIQDLNLGYNVDEVVAAYPHVALVVGDEVDDMTRQGEDGSRVSEWPKVWGRLTATGRRDVATAIWAAHERTPERLVEQAGKALSGSRKKKPS